MESIQLHIIYYLTLSTDIPLKITLRRKVFDLCDYVAVNFRSMPQLVGHNNNKKEKKQWFSCHIHPKHAKNYCLVTQKSAAYSHQHTEIQTDRNVDTELYSLAVKK